MHSIAAFFRARSPVEPPHSAEFQGVWLNNASETLLPKTVLEAGHRAINREAIGSSSFSALHDAAKETDADAIRRLFASIIGATENDIAIVLSTAFAITMAAHNLCRLGKIPPNSKILLIQDQMPSAVYPWQELGAKAEGLELEVVPYPTSEKVTWTELIVQRLSDSNHKISVVCLPQCHWADGSFIDLPNISQICRKQNIPFIVDATQTIGVMPFSLSEIDADMVAVSIHKWLLGPHGASLVYLNPRHHDSWLPLDQHDRARVCHCKSQIWDASQNKMKDGLIAEGAGYPREFVNGARRLDSGGKPNPILLPMLRAALQIVASYNIEAIQSNLAEINKKILDGAVKLGFGTTPGPRAGHILGLRPQSQELQHKLTPETTPETMIRVCKRLEEKGVYISVRCGAFRVSPYLNNTDEDVRIFLAVLEEECCDDLDDDGFILVPRGVL